MGGIIYTPPAAAGTTINATNNKVPRRLNATTFQDSNISDSSALTEVYDASGGNGLKNDYGTQKVKIGQQLSQGNSTYLEVDNNNGTIAIEGALVMAASAGASSGRFLNIIVKGVAYKIDLLNV